MTDGFFEGGVVNFVQLRARDRLGRIGDNAERERDCGCGVAMVARDHDRADACRAALLNCADDLGADGVDHPDEANED
ncbi:hypothetical protein SDC9_211282 [bioreactor metagenome]|uniref:Uncharacterized protein n=1 Tax=bioreactor metagenome TaxID=1076179 RepID=A0A645JIK8_9ZZZZ